MKWEITIEPPFQGFAPGWWKNTYPSYGNKGQAGAMANIDLTDPATLTQGPGLANLINATQATAVTTLIKGITDKAVATNSAFATGGDKLYALDATTVNSSAIWPHTINHGSFTGETGEDVCYFQDNLYYTYNGASNSADIGKYDMTTTFDDDWGSTVPTGAVGLQSDVPHQMINQGEFMYIANKSYVTSYDGDNNILTEKDLDLKDGSEIQSMVMANDRLYVAANQPDVAGSNRNEGAIYVWEGQSDSWEPESIFGLGRVGALYVRNGVVFVFQQDVTSTGGYKLGYISGSQVTDLAHFKGSLPAFYQVSEYENFIVWAGGSYIYAWGSVAPEMPVMSFQLMSGGYSTLGGISAPFGSLLVASNATTNYKLAKNSGYEVTECNWKSLNFDVSAGNVGKSYIDTVVLTTDTLAANARVDLKITADLNSTTWTDSLSHTGDGAVMSKIFKPSIQCSNFRMEYDFTSGNATSPVKIRSCRISGHTI